MEITSIYPVPAPFLARHGVVPWMFMSTYHFSSHFYMHFGVGGELEHTLPGALTDTHGRHTLVPARPSDAAYFFFQQNVFCLIFRSCIWLVACCWLLLLLPLGATLLEFFTYKNLQRQHTHRSNTLTHGHRCTGTALGAARFGGTEFAFASCSGREFALSGVLQKKHRVVAIKGWAR